VSVRILRPFFLVWQTNHVIKSENFVLRTSNGASWWRVTQKFDQLFLTAKVGSLPFSIALFKTYPSPKVYLLVYLLFTVFSLRISTVLEHIKDLHMCKLDQSYLLWRHWLRLIYFSIPYLPVRNLVRRRRAWAPADGGFDVHQWPPWWSGPTTGFSSLPVKGQFHKPVPEEWWELIVMYSLEFLTVDSASLCS
jgi:hypothetical protein